MALLGRADLNRLTGTIVDAAMEVHSTLGPGLLEHAYEACLAHELALRGVDVRAQVPLPLTYKGHRVDAGFRVDLLVNDCVIVEVKAVSRLLAVHEAQLISYLRTGGYLCGLLVNFHERRLKHGIRRFLNGSPP